MQALEVTIGYYKHLQAKNNTVTIHIKDVFENIKFIQFIFKLSKYKI